MERMDSNNIEQRIYSYNDDLLHKDLSKTPIGLFRGKMGLCIYFYMQYSEYGDIRFMKEADKLLQDIYSYLQDDVAVNKDSGIGTNMQDGLTGIAFGLMFLMDSGLCDGNPNFVLRDIDYVLYKYLYNSNKRKFN